MNGIADNSIAGKTCSICQSVIISGEEVVSCPHCQLPFHKECWNENKGCSAYGCESAAETEKEEAPPDFLTQNVWGGSKECPACGKEIKGQALKCRFCGASFATRDAVTRDEYEKREYEGKELNNARNWVIAIFLASATGLLSPIMIFISGILIFMKSLGSIDFKRLPQALQAILYVAFGVNVFMIFFLVFIIIFDS